MAKEVFVMFYRRKVGSIPSTEIFTAPTERLVLEKVKTLDIDADETVKNIFSITQDGDVVEYEVVFDGRLKLKKRQTMVVTTVEEVKGNDPAKQ